MVKNSLEQTLVIIKPDGIVKSLTGNILSILSETKLKIVGAKLIRVNKELAERHYEKHKGKFYYDGLIDYLCGNLTFHTNRVLVLAYEGKNAVNKVRRLIGDKNPELADPLTIRGKYGRVNSKNQAYENVIHSSDGVKEAEREIKIWFSPSELANVIYPVKSQRTVKNELKWV
jgi:nucleoside-diphosphate kinase